jgi:SAM-dependent methyltransferase
VSERLPEERRLLRQTFDDGSAEYDRARPVAPDHMFDDLVSLAALGAGARVLEIGCGTGQNTTPLAERGFEIVAVELGESMAELARRNLAAFPDVTVVTSSFEEWDSGDERFDAVVSFNAFHWIDPEVAYSKSAAVLRDGGALGVYGTRFATHDDSDPVWLATREDHLAATGEQDERMFLPIDHVRDRSDEFTDGGRFATVTVRRYRWDESFDADGYVALLGTVSTYRALAGDVRSDLFERIHRRISAAGRPISLTVTAVLYVARRSSTPADGKRPA